MFNGPNLLLDLPCLTEAFCKKMENKHVEVILKKNYSIYDYSVIKRNKWQITYESQHKYAKINVLDSWRDKIIIL